MNFADAITQAYETRWSFVNTFQVQFIFPPKLVKAGAWEDGYAEDLQLHIINIDTPQFTNAPIEAFVANKWILNNGRDEVYRFSVTFRDKNQLEIYRKFLKMYNVTKEQYFDDAKISIKIFKDSDWSGEVEDNKLFDFSEVLIENISNIQFNNTTENQIAEFSVGFKTSTNNSYL